MTKDARSASREALNLSHPMQQRIEKLGLSPDTLDEQILLTLSALLETIEDQGTELDKAQEHIKLVQQLADMDEVVRIPNRRAFLRKLEWAISIYKRHGHPCSVAFFDLNCFKEINDNYGHLAGDMALRHAASVFNHGKRDTDFLARIGGDEFALILEFADEEAAQKRATELADRLKHTPFRYEGHMLYMSTSFGACGIQPGDDVQTALHRADMAMYELKKHEKRSVSTA